MLTRTHFVVAGAVRSKSQKFRMHTVSELIPHNIHFALIASEMWYTFSYDMELLQPCIVSFKAAGLWYLPG